MSVYQRPDSPDWWYEFRYKGVRFRGSTEVPLGEPKSKAERVESEKRTEAPALLAKRNSKEITLNEALDRYYEEIAKFQSSAADTDRMLASLIWLGKDRLLSEPIDSRLAEYVAWRRGHKVKNTDRMVSNATVNRDTELLRRVYRRAVDAWKFPVAMPDWQSHLLPEADERERELTVEEQESLLAALRKDFWPLIEFALLTGIRLSNLIRLTWSDVKSDGYIVLRVKSRKPGGKIHRVPVTRIMRLLLAEQNGLHPIYVFTYECKRSRGKRKKGERYPFSKNGWRKAWMEALAAAGIEDFRFHDLRHTAATRVARRYRNLKVVQKMLGHANIASTARYAHATEDDVRQAMEDTHSDGFGHESPHGGEAADPNDLNGKEESA